MIPHTQLTIVGVCTDYKVLYAVGPELLIL